MNTPNISHQALKILVEREPYRFLDETGTPEIKHITEKLELELGESLKGRRVSISDIKGVKSRFVSLIGSDDNLLDAVGAYIYCLNCIEGGTSLFYHSFRGKSDDCLAKVLTAKYIFMNDTTIRQWTAARDIFENERLIGHGTVCKNVSSTGYPKTMDGDLLEHIRQGRSVFLSDLKYPNSLLLESIGKRIKGIVTHWKTYEVDKRGLLITSAESEKDLPNFFVKQFEVIDLEAGNKDTPQQIKLLRGKKECYAKPDEFNSFLLDIIKKYKNITLDKKATMAINQMEGRKLFLNDKGKPLYKKSTIKKRLSELNSTKKTNGKS
jgi:hypothetical protein